MVAEENLEQHGRKYCGARKLRGQGTCMHPAGWGTSHPGYGTCKNHGGSTPNSTKYARKQMAMDAVVTYGLPRDIDPSEALLDEVHWTAGHVEWLRLRVQAIEDDDLVWGVTSEVEKHATEFGGTDTTREAGANIWLKLYQQERKHLLDVCKVAIAAGIEQRRVELAEKYGAAVVAALKGALEDLDLTPEQKRRVPEVIPALLRSLAAGPAVT